MYTMPVHLSAFHGGSVDLAGETEAHVEPRPAVSTRHYAVFEAGASPLTIALTAWQGNCPDPYSKTLKPYPRKRFVPLAEWTACVLSILARLSLIRKGKEAWARRHCR